MIKILIGEGTEANLDPLTVDAVRRGEGKAESLVIIGVQAIRVMEAPESLGKRVRAAVKAAGGKPGRVKVEAGGAGDEKGQGDGQAPPEGGDGQGAQEEGEYLPPGGEGPGGMST